MSDDPAPRLRVLLIACYELGHQPLALAWPLALLRPAGFDVTTLDLSAQPFDEALARSAQLVAIAAPMHTALRLGAAAAERVRALNPSAHICFWGLYAALNADSLLATLADSVVPGEDETVLVGLAQALATGADPASVAGLAVRGGRARPALNRPALPVPDRRGLPSLARYARYVQNGTAHLAGYVEASRGCLHTCRHCPIVPVYGGRFFVVPAETVMADVRQQVADGAEHISFGDPDFLNGPGHALRVTRALHAEFPELTFDFTTKVEHILRHRDLFAQFADLGAAFVTSAIESLSPLVLARLAKGHTAADIDAALEILDAAGLALRPTLVAFTPWTTLGDYVALLDFIEVRGLQTHIPPIQLTIRLLSPPGSPLAEAPDANQWLRALDPAAFGYRWAHSDARMDRLQAQVADCVALATEQGEAELDTYAAVKALALEAAGTPEPAGGTPGRRHRPRPAPPRLTEDWFC
jgi:radical SAM superfamily enzyme YgiQ (UPF0313 family)